MMKSHLRLAISLVATLALLAACAGGPRVTFQGQDVDQETELLTQAANIAETTWVHIFEAAEQRHLAGNMSDADWKVYAEELAHGMVHNLDTVQDRLEAYLLTPTELTGTRAARRIEARQAVVALQATVQKALVHARNTLGEAYQ